MLLQQIQHLPASDIINIAGELKRKNLLATPVNVKVYDDHIIIEDEQHALLSWTKRALKPTG